MADPIKFRPKTYPAPEFPPRRVPMFSRMPPAVFASLMGLLGLGLALRRGLAAAQLEAGPGELALGLISGLYLFALIAYASKIARRPSVVIDELKTLPGRTGLSAASLSVLLLAAVLLPYSAALAKVTLFAGLALHTLLALLILRHLRAAPPEAREVTPVWHLHFVGFIIGALTAAPLGLLSLATAIFYLTLPIAVVLWLIGVKQIIQRIPPAPLRPLLAIHLAPLALFASSAALLGMPRVGLGFAIAGMLFAALLTAAFKWLTVSGFSALWGAFTFPVAALASAFYLLQMDVTGTIVLICALGLIPPIAFHVLKGWAKGGLAAKTNAAQA